MVEVDNKFDDGIKEKELRGEDEMKVADWLF